MDGSEEDIGYYSSDRVNLDENKQLEVGKNVGMTYPQDKTPAAGVPQPSSRNGAL